MANKSALILFAHGARDPRWREPFLRLRQMIQGSRSDIAVELAFLEIMTPTLPEMVAQLVINGYQSVTVVPVFLGQGGHVLRDLPVLADQVRAAHPLLDFKVQNAIGEDDSVLKAICDYCLKSI